MLRVGVLFQQLGLFQFFVLFVHHYFKNIKPFKSHQSTNHGVHRRISWSTLGSLFSLFQGSDEQFRRGTQRRQHAVQQAIDSVSKITKHIVLAQTVLSVDDRKHGAMPIDKCIHHLFPFRTPQKVLDGVNHQRKVVLGGHVVFATRTAITILLVQGTGRHLQCLCRPNTLRGV